MNRFGAAGVLSIAATLALAGVARAGSLDGVITTYESGNQGTDTAVRTSDGKTHALWFDNMKKPTFQGQPLPWCPDFPCDGWPKALVLNKTRVRVYTVTQTVEGRVIQSPTRIELLH
ncbi:MAG: hypothetical protein WAJ85_09720 [Candidatus Baltobacteraceae bacterium]|jgi:hypothetical protein